MTNNTNAYGQVITNGKQVYTEIIINATAQKVWSVLTDFAAYPLWNPFIKSFKGVPVVNGNIEVQLQLPSAKAMAFKPRVLQYTQYKELRWIGRLFLPRIFDGEHTFALHDNGDGTTTFMQYEHFRGILIPFMAKMLDVDTASGFTLMNEALKARVEQG